MARGSDNDSKAVGLTLAEHRNETLEKIRRSPLDPTGVSLTSLKPMSRLIVRTLNTVYRLVILGAESSVLVQGGSYFPEATEVQFDGSRFGKTLKTGWIGLGYSMQLSGPLGPIVTSTVRTVEVERGSVHGPF